MALPVLVLRPQPGADETVAELRARGWAAIARPVIATEAVARTPESRARVQRLDEFDLVIFTSPAAVRFGMPQLDEYWPQFPHRLCWVAVGARTRSELEAWDLEAHAPRDERTEGLLDLAPLRSGDVERVLIVRGEGGRETLADTLAERGLRVEHLIVHRRRPLHVELPAPETIAAVVATSRDVVDAFLACGGATFRDRPLLVPSERVADHARAAGFAGVRNMAGAGFAATIRALREAGIAPAPDGIEGGQQ
jgi:uroporphyrinogen-III synthase